MGGRAARRWVAAAALAGLAAAAPTAAVARLRVPRFAAPHTVARLNGEASVLEINDADLDGDGRRDVLVVRGRWASTTEYPMSVLAGDGRGGFADRTAALFGGAAPTAVWPRATLLTDLNGDRRPDVFVGDSGLDVAPWPGHQNELRLSEPDGTLRDGGAGLPPDIHYFHSLAAGDFDRDGDTDLVLADLGSPVRLLLNDGHGRFRAAPGRLPASVQPPRRFVSALAADLNGDRAPDLVLGSDTGPGGSVVLIDDGHGRFRERPHAMPRKPWGTNDLAISMAAIDLNGDRFPDLLAGHTRNIPYYKGRRLQALVNDGHGRFRDATARRLPRQAGSGDLPWPYKILPADLNGDGATDFAVDVGSAFCCPGLRTVPPFFLNRGDGTFVPLPARAFAGAPPFAQLRIFDADGDHRPDVFSVWQALPSGPERYVVARQRP